MKLTQGLNSIGPPDCTDHQLRSGHTPTAPPDNHGPHRLPVLNLEQNCYDHTRDCIQCGLCLPACPTYATTGLEADSPRGRIRLIKALADGRIALTEEVTHHLDLCLDCRACETACPSGVNFHELIETTRAQTRVTHPPAGLSAVVDWAVCNVLPYPARFRAAMAPAWVLQRLKLWSPLIKLLEWIAPDEINKLFNKTPPPPHWGRQRFGWGTHAPKPVDGVRRGTVALFVGCVGRVLEGRLHQQTIELLQHLGFEVVVPPDQVCCGAMHQHLGCPDQAARFAAANLEAFGFGFAHGRQHDDHFYVASNIAGCGAMLRQYGQLMHRRGNLAKPARQFSARVRDVSECIATADPPRPSHEIRQTATYHDACHLAHAQGVTQPPRQILSWIPELDLRPLAESTLCCGAAGAYHLFQPEMARALGERKIRRVAATGAQSLVVGNLGCSLHLQGLAAQLGTPLRCHHPVSLLHQAYGLGKRKNGEPFPV